MSIGEVARRAGIRPSALRYYERIGVLAREKLPEVEALVEHTLGMKRLLERGLRVLTAGRL